MKRFDLNDKYDVEEAKRINAQQWQLDLLQKNPDYNGWGIHEDYMINDGDGWDSSKSFNSWSSFGPWGLDDLNECVNFYFFLKRESEECKCRDGYHKEARNIVDGFYAHSSRTGIGWNDKITQDEVEALWKEDRLYGYKEMPTCEEVNERQNKPEMGLFGHDAINRCVLIRQRCARLGLKLLCEECEGRGYVYTQQECNVGIMLWMIHPRKGCSRGIEVLNIKQEEIQSVEDWLKIAKERNSNRFGKI